MNKKLIALAVAGACVAPTVMAQTANPVTLYGRAYATFESVEAKGGATPVARRNRVTDQASYVGVRGTEDLGGGLKAFFQMEWGYRLDDNGTGILNVNQAAVAGAQGAAQGATAATVANVNNTPFSGRNSAIGLQGGFGSILLGRWDTPMKVTQTAVDPYGDLTLGDITGAALRQGNFSLRMGNSVQYWSPTWAGFSVRGLYVANEAKNSNRNPGMWGGSVAYSAGNLYVAYAYEKHDNFRAGNPIENESEEGNALAASYKFGNLKLSGQYGEYERTNTAKQKSYAVGLEWAFGKNVLLFLYQNSKDGGSNVATGTPPAAPAQPECDMYSIGYRYDFSRRTFFIASYTKVDNKIGSLCNFGTETIAIGANQDPQGVGLGVRHLF